MYLLDITSIVNLIELFMKFLGRRFYTELRSGSKPREQSILFVILTVYVENEFVFI